MPVTINGGDGITNASWTTGTRPSNPAAGQMGYNTDISNFEIYNGSDWVNIADISQQKNSLLLNQVQEPTVVYSLRKLAVDDTDPIVLRVRRSSDNSESDFSVSEINDGSLESFCGSGDGFVAVWYDQSNNQNNASEATSSKQPKIVNNGSIITINNKPALEFDGSDDRLEFSVSTAPPFLSVFLVAGPFSDAAIFDNYYDSGLQEGFFINTDSLDGRYDDSGDYKRVEYDNKTFTNNTRIFSAIFDDNSLAKVMVNDNIYTEPRSLPYNFSNEFSIGGRQAGNDASGFIQEVIIYFSPQSGNNRELIKNSMNNHYGVF